MGQQQANVEITTDYSTQQSCVRLHIDLLFANEQIEGFRNLMESGKHSDAFALVRQATHGENRMIVEAFERAFATIERSRLKAA